MDKENFRAYIKVRTALSIQPKTIHDELYSVFGDQAPSYGTVAKWPKWFREGRETIEDHPRPGRPVTETTSENIEEIRSLINDDPHLTIDEIQVETGMSRGTIERIISNHLQLKKITARWVPNVLTDNQRSERVRICKDNLEKFNQGTWRLCDVITGDESWFYHKQIGRKISNAAWTAVGGVPPTVARRSRFAPKTLLCVFFKTTGPVIIHHVQRGETINHQYYINNCLQPLIDKIWKQRPTSGTHAIKLHHDNAKPHVHKDVLCYLESKGIKIIRQPPNSPDLAPCDFWLFDRIKQHLTDQTDSNSLHRAVTMIMHSFSKEDYKKTFDIWMKRMQLCVDNQGDYFEHLMK